MTIDVVELTQRLVAIPSVNPMGSGRTGPQFLETQLTDALVAWALEHGIAHERHAVHPERDNLLFRCDADSPSAPILLLDAHQDTVPVDGMTIPPFEPVLRDGRLYGRGTCDIKGGLAVMLCVLARLQREKPALRPHVVVSATVNEEFGFSGAARLVELFSQGASKVLPRPPDACLVAEPTLLNVVVAHKGGVRWSTRTLGVAAHSSKPERGANAIYRMAPVLAALEKYAKEIAPYLASNPWVGGPTLSVGMIEGGMSVNTVPDRCSIDIDRRLVPGESPLEARQHAIDYLTQSLGREYPVEHDAPAAFSLGLRDHLNRALAESLALAATNQGCPAQQIGVPYGTNASLLGQLVPTVVFGPGDIAQAHTADEFVAVEQLQAAAEILFRFASDAANLALPS